MARFSIFGYYGQGNAGDEAILAALIDGIKAEIPNSEISVYSANPTETKKSHNVDAFHFFGLDTKSIIKSLIRKSRFDFINAFSNFLKSDVIVIGGGGLFFDTKETNKWIFGYLKLIHSARRFGKKVALVGISVGPLHHKGSEKAIKEAFALADLISVRDNISRDTLLKCGLAFNKIKVIPDLVFTLNSATDARIEAILAEESFPANTDRNIALTPCCYNAEKSGWLEQYVAFCERAVAELDCNLWLIPMQRHDNHDDLSAINTIYSGLSDNTRIRTHKLQGLYSAKEIQGVIGKANVVLAERLHGSIMAVNTCTPVMSIAYMPKVVGVLELAKLEDRIIANSDFLSGDFQHKAFEFYRQYIGPNAVVDSFKSHPRKLATRNFNCLRDLTI